MLADLGVSSLQLEMPERGFSFRREGPLDMRMGPGGLTAADLVNSATEGDLERIFREYGEERQARRIARAIATRPRRAPVETTAELKRRHRPGQGERRGREGRVDPATRVFQALRIAVNEELAGLEGVHRAGGAACCRGDGRLVVISYHSLEDRIVKNTLRDLARGEIDRITGRPRCRDASSSRC